MALTRDFRETVLARVNDDPEFARALFDEAITLFLNDDSATAKAILRDVINSTIGFETLAIATQKSSKSIHRMLSASGNPTMSNLASIFGVLRDALHVEVLASSVSLS